MKITDCHCHVYPDTIASKAVGSIASFYDFEATDDMLKRGTDYPMKTPEEELEILFGLGFSERELDLITHLNAEKIFGINTYAVEYPFPL